MWERGTAALSLAITVTRKPPRHQWGEAVGVGTKRIALGRFSNKEGERYFVLMGGVGFDATVVLSVNAKLKAKTGKFAYWVAGFAQAQRRHRCFRLRTSRCHRWRQQ